MSSLPVSVDDRVTVYSRVVSPVRGSASGTAVQYCVDRGCDDRANREREKRRRERKGESKEGRMRTRTALNERLDCLLGWIVYPSSTVRR